MKNSDSGTEIGATCHVFKGLCKGIYLQDMALQGRVPPVLVPEMAIDKMNPAEAVAIK